MKRLLFSFLTLMVLAGIFSISPADATALAPTYNGDGVLSLAERNALNALPITQATATTLQDVRASDLPYLDSDLQDLLRRPARIVHWTEGTADGAAAIESGGCTPGVPGCWRRSSHVHKWRTENIVGATLTRFEHHMTWSWNYLDVRNVDDWWESSASAVWGWTKCGYDPQYRQWGTRQNYMNLVVRAEFGAIWPAGCSVILNRLGAEHRVQRNGRVTLIRNWCEGNCTSTGTGGPG